MKALVVVDVQNDFVERGSLAVNGGTRLAEMIHLKILYSEYDFLVATQDWHMDPGTHWVKYEETPNFVTTWPIHCEAKTEGAKLVRPLRKKLFDTVVRKGQHSGAYSGFEGITSEFNSLEEWLQDREVSDLDICGIATDHCVKATAIDASRLGFNTVVLSKLCVGVAPDTTKSAITEMIRAGVRVQ